MDFKVFGQEGVPTLMLIPGLGVSYEIFLPLIDMLKDWMVDLMPWPDANVSHDPEVFCFNEGRVRLLM